MQGVLKPTPPRRDGYSRASNLPNNGYYSTAQYQQPPQPVQVQQPQSSQWPTPVETPYYPSARSYGTPSAQYSSQYNAGAYATPEQPSSASQPAQYSAYDESSNTYNYPDPTQAAGYTPEQPAEEASEEPASPTAPDSAQKDYRPVYGSRHSEIMYDLDELMSVLQADIDASCVDGVHGICKTELRLGGNAFVPLLRPNIGPYADGGTHDLPVEFKTNYPDDIAKEKASGQDSQAEPQTQAQDPSQQDATADSTANADGATATQKDTNSSTPQQTPATTNNRPEPEDPLKRCPNATVDCILGIADKDVRGIIQRAASRGLVQKMSNIDGYKYMFNNFWTSHADGEGLRYSYTCRDSLQNKDRFAHVPARPTTAAPSSRGPTPRRMKESWDCKGSLSIKFSQTAGTIIIQYRHAAVHPTHAARKKAPRKPAGPKATRGPGRPKGSTGTKRKWDSETGGFTGFAESPYTSSAAQYTPPVQREPSLFELLQQSAIESAANEDGGQLGDTSRPWWSST